jgi:active breakpoint cluster region-related protein
MEIPANWISPFSDAYEAEQLLKEVDIHSVTGNLKSYLRELPEALFTDQHYQKVS